MILTNKSETQESGVVGRATGSEHSNDTENMIDQQKDVSAIYDEYREIFNEYKLTEKDQILIFKSFENKFENDIKLFIQ